MTIITAVSNYLRIYNMSTKTGQPYNIMLIIIVLSVNRCRPCPINHFEDNIYRPFPNVLFITCTDAAVGSWLSANCGTKMRSVCKKPKGGFIATYPTPPVAADYCPAGYFSVSGAYAARGRQYDRREWGIH